MEKLMISVALTLPIMYLTMQGLQSLGFTTIPQMVMAVGALLVYDFGQYLKNS